MSEGTGQEAVRFCAHSDADPQAKEVSGEFRFDREGGLTFVCHSLEHDYELTKLALLALKEHVEQQLREEEKCPFFRRQAEGRDGQSETPRAESQTVKAA